ncbi:hypothetical protein SeLEV6574_g06386 [Synchytrium endobioticum]|uniref:FAD-binding domain-containing protein n=1 Tax=Synchytrium endobioticum TaxID=286115 RepID=A0A507CNV9_9FUNG|nr:hypothetical protein SeLEV6574_g06386 [Synchytrium endobioticum]
MPGHITRPAFVIIGSGPAGLAAALSLLDAGYLAQKDFVVLEKRERFQRRPQENALLSCASAKLRHWNVIQKLECRKQLSPRGGRLYVRFEDHKTSTWVGAKYTEIVGEYLGDLSTLSVNNVLDDFSTARNMNLTTIGDTERALLDAATERGVEIIRGAILKLTWLREPQRYHISYSNKEGGPIDLGIPDLVIVCEGASRKLLNKVIGPQHSIRELPEHPPHSYFVCCNVYFVSSQKRRQTMPTGIYIRQYGEQGFVFAPVADAPIRNHETNQAVWVKIPRELVAKAGIWDGAPADVTLAWKDGPRCAVIERFASQHINEFLNVMFGPETLKDVRLGEITEPIQIRDSLLSQAHAGRNLVFFGDAFSTGTFQSGAGMNILLTVDCNSLKSLISTISEYPETALTEYTKNMTATHMTWHARNSEMYYTAGVPLFVPFVSRTNATHIFKDSLEMVEKLVAPAMKVMMDPSLAVENIGKSKM